MHKHDSGFIFSGIHRNQNDEKHMPEAMEGFLGSKNDLKKAYRDFAKIGKC